MKKLNTLFITIIVLVLAANINLKADSSVTMKFVTSGNCIVCKVRIEDAVNTLPGINSIFWDSNTQASTVTFDTTKVDIHTIMKKIASVGHDTEWYEGDHDKYFALIGTCCEYPRTIKYEDAKIGYLSLMDKWVPVETNPIDKISVFSGYNGKSLKYSITGYEHSPISIYIFSMLGEMVYSNSEIKSSDEIDLSSFSNGTYIITMTNQNKRIFVKKIIK